MKLNNLTCALAIAAIISTTSALAGTPQTVNPQGAINGLTFVGVDIAGNKTDRMTFVINGTDAEQVASGEVVKFDSEAALLTAVANLQVLNPDVRVGWVNGQEQVLAARAAFDHDPAIAKTIVDNDNLPGKLTLIGKKFDFDQTKATPAEHAEAAAPVYMQTLVEIGAVERKELA